MDKVKVAVLVSGGGTNLQAIIDANKAGIIQSANIELVISDNANAYALERAKMAGIPAQYIEKGNNFESELRKSLVSAGIELIVLAGFLSILSPELTAEYDHRIINVHPSLIPSFCGKGYYGLKVHKAALEKGVKVTGATVHFVNEIPDGGEIIDQRAVYVKEGDTPDKLQKRVMEEAEWVILPRAIETVAKAIQR